MAYLSLMKSIRSLANNPKLDKQENPNKARVKKNMPRICQNKDASTSTEQPLTQSVLEASDIIRDIMEEETADDFG